MRTVDRDEFYLWLQHNVVINCAENEFKPKVSVTGVIETCLLLNI